MKEKEGERGREGERERERGRERETDRDRWDLGKLLAYSTSMDELTLFSFNVS